MAVDLSGLTKYVDERKLGLIGDTIKNARTLEFVNLQTGINGKATINRINQSIILQTGSCNAFTNSGTTSISQRTIEVKPVRLNMSYCEEEFLPYFIGAELAYEAGRETIPARDQFINDVVAKVANANEKCIWQGDTASGATNVNMFDGFLTVLSGASGVITGATTTAQTVVDAVDLAFDKIPVEVVNDAVIFVGQDTFKKYVKALGNNSLNQVTYNPKVDGQWQFAVPNSNTPIIAVPGLNGSNKIVACDPKNLYVGTSLDGSAERATFVWSDEKQAYLLVIKYVMGVQVAEPNKTVVITIG